MTQTSDRGVSGRRHTRYPDTTPNLGVMHPSPFAFGDTLSHKGRGLRMRYSHPASMTKFCDVHMLLSSEARKRTRRATASG